MPLKHRRGHRDLRTPTCSGPQLVAALSEARKLALKTIEAAPDKHAANVSPIIREIGRAGATTLREIVDGLNARGVATARGGSWYAMTVSNVLARAR